MINREIGDFAINQLVPAASESLGGFYRLYCNGQDIDVQAKGDDTPASRADRETEKKLRELIKAHHPDHSIIGEELGRDMGKSDICWVLDPLDGTREFLAQRPGHFGAIIGVLKGGVPIFGVIIDPIEGKSYSNLDTSRQKSDKAFHNLVLSCTNFESMFSGTNFYNGLNALMKDIGSHVSGLNCIGFAKCATGEVDLAIERDLALHDIAGLIPVLRAAECTAIDFDGTSYLDREFDLSNCDDQKFGIIAAGEEETALKALEYIKR